jgi:prepilin-type processing-associated H-X9-DG protein
MVPSSESPAFIGQTGAAQDNRGCMNTLFFDAHVERLNDRESRQIELWYPTGSVVEDASCGMTDVDVGYVIP